MRLTVVASINEAEDPGYQKWKRDNVSVRGMKGDSDSRGSNNSGSGVMGKGLYTTPLSNKSMAKGYGDLKFVVGGIPQKPLVVNSINDWEIWTQRNLYMRFSKDEFPDEREFNKNTTIQAELQKMGYDGVIIKGREMVKYSPEDVRYFESEDQLKSYYERIKS